MGITVKNMPKNLEVQTPVIGDVVVCDDGLAWIVTCDDTAVCLETGEVVEIGEIRVLKRFPNCILTLG